MAFYRGEVVRSRVFSICFSKSTTFGFRASCFVLRISSQRPANWLCFLSGKIPQNAIILVIFLFQRAYTKLPILKLALFCIFSTADYTDIADLTCFKLFSSCHRCSCHRYRGRYGQGQHRAMPWANRFLFPHFNSDIRYSLFDARPELRRRIRDSIRYVFYPKTALIQSKSPIF